MNKSPLLIHDAGRWVNCTGSVSLIAKFPAIEDCDGVSEARLEGRAFHETAEKMLHLALDGLGTQPNDFVGSMSSDGMVITDEIYEGARVYADDVLSVVLNDDTLDKLKIEQLVDTGNLSDDTYGYVDAWVFNPETMTLTMWEGKFGHTHVEVFENWQLLCYASGILESLSITGLTDQMINLDMRIVQPRCFTSEGIVRSWKCKASDIRPHVNTIEMAAAEALNDGQCEVGTWCRNCPARRACRTLQRVNYQYVDYQSNAEGVQLKGNDLALELTILNRASVALKARLSGLEEQALSEIKQGVLIPGFTTHQGNGRQTWKKDIDQNEVIDMGDMLGYDFRKPRVLDTPTQALKKGVDESVILEYSYTPKTKVKLIETSSTQIRKMFSSIEGT